jgi:uncharacterized membrane protein
MRNSNQNLFWYGMKSTVVETLGLGLILLGFVFGLVTMKFWLVFVSLAIGAIFIFKGKAMRFDYQRQSGSIIHRGDGW